MKKHMVMKDLFDFAQYDDEAKDDILIQIRVNGNSMSKTRLDDLNYRFYVRKIGESEMRKHELLWNNKSENLYQRMEEEKLIRMTRNWVQITDEGLRASKLGYTKFLFRKKLDKFFGEVKKVSDFINGISKAQKWITVVGTAIISAILYIANLLLQ